MSADVDAFDFLANGVRADTGMPLSAPEDVIAQTARSEHLQKESELASAKMEDAQAAFGVIGDVGDPNDLSEAGWGVVFHRNAPPEIKAALAPLIEHRLQQSGKLGRVFENDDGYQQGQTCVEWLAHHHVSLNVVDPLMGVPFYLMIVGSPEEIPFEFQYPLDMYWGVGRLHFETADEYRRYAESVVAYERAPKVSKGRLAAIFATQHDFDRATQMFTTQVATPLSEGDDKRPPLGKRQNFQLESFIGERATKENLTTLLRGKTAGGAPSLLFTGSHGMAFGPDDPRLNEAQGALVCQDWAGYGQVTAADYFRAEDVPIDAQVHGLIHFFFACYGIGCPQFDDFPAQLGADPAQIAARPIIARLPQRLLAHAEGGALAAFGHVDRAWTHSFSSAKAGPQTQGFRDVMGRIMKGDRIGQATDQFDFLRAVRSYELADTLLEIKLGKPVSDRKLASLWIARNDARDYIILGDPAVRLRVEAMAG